MAITNVSGTNSGLNGFPTPTTPSVSTTNNTNNNTTNNSGSLTSNSLGLSKDSFLKLFLAGMQNQDPQSPMSNSDMMQQMSQLGLMEGIQNLQSVVTNLQNSMVGNQLEQASNLLGKTVVAIDTTGQKIIGAPTATRLNNGIVEYLVNNKIINMGEIQEIGIDQNSNSNFNSKPTSDSTTSA